MDYTSHTAAENKAQLGWDPDDPHGINPHHGEHHHFIADWRMQVTILVVLLFLTALTVAFFRVEAWAEVAFGIHLPGWVNIAGAMSIATIKGTLVAAYFMQLRYDKVLNTFVLLFCLLGVGLFLTFSMIDLNNRNLVNPVEIGEVTRGGTGYSLNSAPADSDFSVRLSPKVNTGGLPIVYAARLKGNNKNHGLEYYREHNKEAEFWEHFYGAHATHRDAMDENDYFTQLGYAHHDEVSNADASRPRHGLTPDLFSDVGPAGHGADTHGSEDASHNDGH